MKKLILVLLGVSLLQLQLIAQSRTIKFQFDPVSTSVVSDVAAMENNISNLLSAINVHTLMVSHCRFQVSALIPLPRRA